jgi:hypothetical protein
LCSLGKEFYLNLSLNCGEFDLQEPHLKKKEKNRRAQASSGHPSSLVTINLGTLDLLVYKIEKWIREKAKATSHLS